MNKLGLAIIILSIFLWPIGALATYKGFESPKLISFSDYQAQQLIIRNTYLYPSVFLARSFQNKLNIPINSFKDNLFSLLDPNYYFFGSHPRELYNQQNRVRLPFIAILFLLYGLICFDKVKHYRVFGIVFVVTVFFLSLLQNFSQFDLVLWPFVSLAIYHGYQMMLKQNKSVTFFLLVPLLFVTLAEYLRVFLIK